MGALKRDRSPSISQLEKLLRKHQYNDEYTDFHVFWRRYKKSGPDAEEGGEKFGFFPEWARKAGLAAVSLAAVLLVILSVNIVNWSGKGPVQFSWNRISGNGVQISGIGGLRWKNIDSKTRLSEGSVLRTDKNSDAVFTVKGSIHLKIFPSSEVKIAKLNTASLSIEMLSGKFAYVSGKLDKGQTVNIATPYLNIEVTGTSFLVSVDQFKNVKISVIDGKVRVTPLNYLLGGAGLTGSRVRGLMAQVLEKAYFPVNQSVEIKADDQEAFYKDSLEIIKMYESDIKKGNTGPCAEKITLLFWKLAATKARFTETAAADRVQLPSLYVERQSGKVGFRPAVEKKMTVTGRESEILELPGGRQCYAVDQNIVFLSASGEMEKSFAVGEGKQSLTRPQSAGDLIVVGSDKGSLYALDQHGASVWTVENAGIQVLNAYPQYCEGRIVVPTVNNGLRFFDGMGNAMPVSLEGAREGVFYSPMIMRKCSAVLFGNESGDFTFYDIDGNKVLWCKNVIREVSVYALAGDDRAVVIQSRKTGTTAAVRPADGSVIWKKVIGGTAKTRVAPLVDGNRVAMGADEKLVVTDLLSGMIVSEKTFQSNIVSIKWFRGKILIGSETGELYLYDVSTGREEIIYHAKGPVSRISVRGDSVTFFTGNALVRLKAENLES